MIYSDLPEGDDQRFEINDEEDALFYEQYRNTAFTYFNAKKQFYDDAFENQLEMTTQEFMEKGASIEVEDKKMNAKLDFMYNYGDFDTDRAEVRTKFLTEMNKRTTLQDISESLDQMVINDKGRLNKYYKLNEHHNVKAKRAGKDFTSDDFKWSGRILKNQDPKTPLFFEDPDQMAQNDEGYNLKQRQIYEKIKFNDA